MTLSVSFSGVRRTIQTYDYQLIIFMFIYLKLHSTGHSTTNFLINNLTIYFYSTVIIHSNRIKSSLTSSLGTRKVSYNKHIF